MSTELGPLNKIQGLTSIQSTKMDRKLDANIRRKNKFVIRPDNLSDFNHCSFNNS